MIKPAVRLRINLRVKNGRKPVGVAVSLKRDVLTSRIGSRNIKRKVAKYFVIKAQKNRLAQDVEKRNEPKRFIFF